MSVPCPLPPDELRAAVTARYGRVATRPDEPAGFPVGRAFAEALGYDPAVLDQLPATASTSFAGVAALPRWLSLPSGGTVIDLGCGAGLDTLIAAQLVGAEGRVIGVDAAPAMVRLARWNVIAAQASNVTIVEAPVEDIPCEGAIADVVIANGIVNLSPEKDRVVGEIARVLKPGGCVTSAEIVLTHDLPYEERATLDDWFR